MRDLSCACRFPTSSGAINDRVVRFPPGRARPAIVLVASFAAWIAGAEADQLGGEIAKPVVLSLRPSGLNGDLLPFDMAQLSQVVSEGVEDTWGSWVRKGGRG